MLCLLHPPQPEFAEEPVIGIVDKYGILLHFETMRSLQNKYKVWSNIPDVVGKEVIEKLIEANPRAKLEDKDNHTIDATRYALEKDMKTGNGISILK